MSRGADANAMSWEEIEAAAKLQVISLCILMIGSYVFESVHAVQQQHHTHRVTAYVSLFVCCRCCHPMSIAGRPELLYLSSRVLLWIMSSSTFCRRKIRALWTNAQMTMTCGLSDCTYTHFICLVFTHLVVWSCALRGGASASCFGMFDICHFDCRYKEQEEAARLQVLDEKDGSPNHAEDSESTCSAERLVIEDAVAEVEPVEIVVPVQAEGLGVWECESSLGRYCLRLNTGKHVVTLPMSLVCVHCYSVTDGGTHASTTLHFIESMKLCQCHWSSQCHSGGTAFYY